MQPDFEPGADHYPFVRVEGDAVHEIPVGPVHAGTIEPGHFRFSIVGEAVVRLEERLGFTHKAIEKRAEEMTFADGALLAGRVSGDSTVAYAWAYAQAVECLLGIQVPERARRLRAILLELERIHNHLGDLGYLGNDVALSFGFVQFWRIKEQVLRLNAELFGHRYLMDRVAPNKLASLGAAVTGVSMVIITLSVRAGADPAVYAGFFLLGLGWSCTLVAGSTLLTAGVPAAERPGAQGASDLVMGLMGGLGGAVAGVVVHRASFNALALASLGVAVVIGLAAVLTARTARPASPA